VRPYKIIMVHGRIVSLGHGSMYGMRCSEMVKDLKMISKSGCSASPLPLHAQSDIVIGI
jgi:hypothetical protein